jgi:hypothetical protein
MKRMGNDGIAPNMRCKNAPSYEQTLDGVSYIWPIATSIFVIMEYGLFIVNRNLNYQRFPDQAFHSRNDTNDCCLTIYDSRNVITSSLGSSKHNSQYLGLAFKAFSQMIQLQCVCSESSNIVHYSISTS